MIRFLEGGSATGSAYVGPVVVVPPYDTVRGGMADEISAASGEVLARYRAGSPSSFSMWVAGTFDEVRDFLLDSDKVERRRGADLLQQLEKLLQKAPTTPVGALAQALGLEAGKVVHAAQLAGVEITFKS